MSDETPAEGQAPEAEEQTFSQADVDRIVRERVQRERSKYADYNDLKAKASEATSIEERLAAMEKRAADAELTALRANVANLHGVSAEDRDLFLTGGDEESLTAQAKRLAERESEQGKRPPSVPKQGTDTNPPKADEMREFTRSVFGHSD